MPTRNVDDVFRLYDLNAYDNEKLYDSVGINEKRVVIKKKIG